MNFILDGPPLTGLLSHHPLAEGRLRRQARGGVDAAPAGGACNLAPGRRWELRPAGHYEPPARSWLTTGIAGESAARRRDKNAAVERREASIPRRHLRRLRKLVCGARDAPPTQSSMRRLRKACLLAEVGAPFGAPLAVTREK